MPNNNLLKLQYIHRKSECTSCAVVVDWSWKKLYNNIIY